MRKLVPNRVNATREKILWETALIVVIGKEYEEFIQFV